MSTPKAMKKAKEQEQTQKVAEEQRKSTGGFAITTPNPNSAQFFNPSGNRATFLS